MKHGGGIKDLDDKTSGVEILMGETFAKIKPTDPLILLLLFIIRVKRELKRVYRNGCRYNERLNTETGGSKTSRTHWLVRVNIQ
jgi:hypothetical protein